MARGMEKLNCTTQGSRQPRVAVCGAVQLVYVARHGANERNFTEDFDIADGTGQSVMCIMPRIFVPRRAGLRKPPLRKAQTRVPPSKSLPFDPRRGQLRSHQRQLRPRRGGRGQCQKAAGAQVRVIASPSSGWRQAQGSLVSVVCGASVAARAAAHRAAPASAPKLARARNDRDGGGARAGKKGERWKRGRRTQN